MKEFGDVEKKNTEVEKYFKYLLIGGFIIFILIKMVISIVNSLKNG